MQLLDFFEPAPAVDFTEVRSEIQLQPQQIINLIVSSWI
jgi:hypothetical protein